MTCTVYVNRHGRLTFRLYWNGIESWEGTGLKDTPKNRKRVEARAELMTEEMEKRAFNYLRWFPKGNKAPLFRPPELEKKPDTVGEYFHVWIESKKPPAVRKGLERDYREHFKRYILPEFETVKLAEVTPRRLLDFRAHLLEKGLKIKSCRIILDASFRAMMRDARRVDHLIETDPFEALDWPRLPASRPEPFDEEERDKVIGYFQAKNRFYYPLVYALFWTGMRPSEALALRWEDVDLRRGSLSISKSRYMGEENPTKTAGSEREIRLLPGVIEVLRAIKPLHVPVDEHIFKNQQGRPISFHTWRAKDWYRTLRALGIKERKPYATRHTFISVGLSNGVNIKWLAEYCGTSVAMIEKHYGRYLRSDSDEQFGRLLGAKPVTFAVTQEEAPEAQATQMLENYGKKGKWAHLDSNQGPTGYEPVALTS